MKLRFAKYALFLAAFLTVAMVVDAQTKKPATRSKTTRTTKTTGKKSTTKKTAKPPPTVKATAKDTLVAPQPQAMLKLDTIRKSLRNDNAIERNLVKDRTPLAYEHIREDDAVYRQRVWRQIDIREKMNLAFKYKADEDNGNQRFISILLNALRSGEVTAFNASVDDRFTVPMSMNEIATMLSGKADTMQIPDWVKDPTGAKGIMKDSVVVQEFNPDDITKFRIKEEWVFDKESSRMYARILGIAPIKDAVDQVTGKVLGETPIFWVYYPDLRPVLARYEVYNGKNFGARMSWEELFESRFFSSYIVKSTIENPYDLFVKQYINDPILRLLEGDQIKDKIFNYEQDLWSY